MEYRVAFPHLYNSVPCPVHNTSTNVYVYIYIRSNYLDLPVLFLFRPAHRLSLVGLNGADDDDFGPSEGPRALLG